MKSARAYTMRARAESAQATRRRILEAAGELLKLRFRSDIRLEEIAAGAGVSVQTVVRVFGGRETLLREAIDVAVARIGASLDRADPGDVEGSISAWFDHYEELGDLVVRNLADEDDPAVGPLVRTGRTRHRHRVERQFGPQLAAVAAEQRRQTVDALVCACDVYTWKLLRRDLRRSRARAEATVAQLVRSVLERG
ncbi:MAG TPA: TetR/AcrR family transcriptional regulator [Mycobacteriales bacterium]|nr:TetR/AcrR family transcriptional regulator [Mycobacteriales bacterium]